MDLAKGINALKSETERNQAVIEIQRILLDVQESALADKERIAGLNRQIVALQEKVSESDNWIKLSAKYRLTQSSGGAYTYDLISDLAEGEAFHRICVGCFEDRKRSILHTTSKHSGGEIVHCSGCGKNLTLSEFDQSIGVAYSTYADRLRGY